MWASMVAILRMGGAGVGPDLFLNILNILNILLMALFQSFCGVGPGGRPVADGSYLAPSGS